MIKTGRNVKCDACGELVYKKKRDILKRKRLYCNDVCYSKKGKKENIPWNKGKVGEYESNPSNARKDEVLFDKKNRAWLYAPTHPKAHRCRVLLSRFTIEKYLGRLLKSNEIVHHIDGDPSNNIIENLYLTDRKEHAKIHKQKNYAKSF